jgi:hypothetical protein
MTDAGPIPQHREYKEHSITAKFPKIETEERQFLIASINEVGLLEPITLYEGMILDGRARYLICKTIQYQFKDTDFVTLPDGVLPVVFWLSKNAARAHWTAEQKREVIRLLLEQYPNHSSRVIAKMVGVSHTTVEAARSTGQIGQLKSDEEESDSEDEEEETKEETRVGADGKRRKSGKKKGGTTAKTLKKQTDKFKSDWDDLNDHQKASFVKDYQNELRELLENVDAEMEGVKAEVAALGATP